MANTHKMDSSKKAYHGLAACFRGDG